LGYALNDLSIVTVTPNVVIIRAVKRGCKKPRFLGFKNLLKT